MRLILYASRSRIEAGSTALIDILGAAVRNNFLAGVTGALYYDGAAFLQALEGPPDKVDAVFARIEADPRHDQMTPLLDRVGHGRRFGAWAMKLALRDDCAALPADVSPQALRGADALQVETLLRALGDARGC